MARNAESRFHNSNFCCFLMFSLQLPQLLTADITDSALMSSAFPAGSSIALDDYCNREGPVITASKYGGTFQFSKYPLRNCNVSLTVAVVPVNHRKYTLYVNVRELHMPQTDVIYVYQHQTVSNSTMLILLKEMWTWRDSSTSTKYQLTKSAGQFRTAAFSHTTALSLEVIRNGIPVEEDHRVVFEYTLTVDTLWASESQQWVYCPALKGYVYGELACKNKDHLTCPTAFKNSVRIHNPAIPVESPCKIVHKAEKYREDFESPSLSGWRTRTATKSLGMNRTMRLRPENVQVADGLLQIRAEVRSDSSSRPSYYAGQISSGSVFSFTYGEVVIRAKLPVGNLRFLSVASYFRLVDHRCAFDESPVCKEQAIYIADLITADSNRVEIGVSYGPPSLGDVADFVYAADSCLADGQFHLFRMQWRKDRITWFVDDVEIKALTDVEKIPTTRMQILIELAAFPGFRPANMTTELLIDYIIVREDLPEGADLQLKIWASVGTLLSAVLLLLGLLCYWHRRMKRREAASTSVADVRAATNKHITEMYRAWTMPATVARLKIPRRALKIERKLDEGEFGIVWKGRAMKLRQCAAPRTVAVKCVKNFADANQHKLLMEEAAIHGSVGRHLNIVNLLGIVLAEQLHLLLEYSPFGSLLKYLRDQGKLSRKSEGSELRYVNAAVCDPTTDTVGCDLPTPAEYSLLNREFINFTYQISRGMEYLALHSVIHRDLAARNILVYDNKILRICDFGLAKQKSEYYRMADAQNAKIPARWMAPESLQDRIFTEKTDVWSFGIVIWEMFSFGKVPYHDTFRQIALQEFTSALHEGLRPVAPPNCPEEVCKIMEQCWRYDAAQRPSFTSLVQTIETLVDRDAQNHYVQLNQPYVIFNQNNCAAPNLLETDR
ncbi:vascular endothelial growth factor receptor 1-like isoform X2 [Paramacrobiotus metropolitanus]|uniref:vascular endothelial growth factor receptor 1-like isoform X2 n=1 Tax=Paramacrobiotus metropolitanus TaxID=2943436 RepID=UPI0024464974|nr:vascular endothelial growth factor receptor 1-like isoform X2 [Paramacrobiotus metropolitanus]